MAETYEVGDDSGKDTGVEELGKDIEVDDLPLRGDPEQFLIAVENLKEGGARKVGDLEDEIEEYGSTNLSGNLKFGEVLEFIERTSDGVALTDRGYRLAFAAEENEDLSELFREGLQDAEPYIKLLRGLIGDYEEGFDSLVKNSDVLQVMRTKYGMREADEGKLKRAISIMFDGLEEAGYGERKMNSGEYPIRFSFSDEWTLRSMVGDLVPESDAKTGEPVIDDEEVDKAAVEEPENEDENTDRKAGEDSSDKPQVSEEKPDRENSPEFDDSSMGETEIPSKTQTVNITVNIDLDVNEMDTAEFEKKLEYLSNLLNSKP